MKSKPRFPKSSHVRFPNLPGVHVVTYTHAISRRAWEFMTACMVPASSDDPGEVPEKTEDQVTCERCKVAA